MRMSSSDSVDLWFKSLTMHSVNIEIKPFIEIQNDTIQHSFMTDLKDAVTEISGLYFHNE